ncbi:MAG: DUF1501 domain-containing protein [Armatimonadota bacterium]
MSCRHFEPVFTRRALLQQSACGIGMVALASLLGDVASRAAEAAANPLAARPPHFAPRAKRLIFLFMHGGVSQVDSFDPKPMLAKMNGEPLPFPKPKVQFAETGNLLKSPWEFRSYGQSGLPVSDLFPQIGSCADDLCVVRSLHADQSAHGGALLQLHTGAGVFIRPSMGSWLVYGLGTENRDLPGYVTICPTLAHGGVQNFGSAFLPAWTQGTRIGNASIPTKQSSIRNLENPDVPRALQRKQLDFLQGLNREHLSRAGEDLRLEGQIENFELAFRMQTSAPELMELSGESKATLDLYGIGREPTDNFGRQCLLARRFAERGVRVVQCTHSYKWDQHGNLKEDHAKNAAEVDLPIAGLLKDLKGRGMLEDTLVLWATEFGRTPTAQGKDGRDHNPHGFTVWLAGGGVKGGTAYGATDEFGYYAVENKVHIHDLHATLLHLLGLDHERLTYRHAGRDFRLTDVHGRVVKEIFA